MTRSTKRTTSSRYHRHATSTHADDDDNELLIESVLGQNNNGLYQRRKDYAPMRGGDLTNEEFRGIPGFAGPSPSSIFKVPSWLSKKKESLLQCICMVCGLMIYLIFVRMSSGINHAKKVESMHIKKMLDNFVELPPAPNNTLSKLKRIPFRANQTQTSLRGYGGSILDIDLKNNDDMVVNFHDKRDKKSSPGLAFEDMHDDYVKPIQTINTDIFRPETGENQPSQKLKEVDKSSYSIASSAVVANSTDDASLMGASNGTNVDPLKSTMVSNIINISTGDVTTDKIDSAVGSGGAKELEVVLPKSTNNTNEIAKEHISSLSADQQEVAMVNDTLTQNDHLLGQRTDKNDAPGGILSADLETHLQVFTAPSTNQKIVEGIPTVPIVNETEASVATANDTVTQNDHLLDQRTEGNVTPGGMLSANLEIPSLNLDVRNITTDLPEAVTIPTSNETLSFEKAGLIADYSAERNTINGTDIAQTLNSPLLPVHAINATANML